MPVKTIPAARFRNPGGRSRRIPLQQAIRNCRESIERGEEESASAVLRQLLKTEPANLELLSLLETTCKKTGNFDPVIEPFRKAIALHPGSSALYCSFGLTLLESLRYEESVAAFRSALKLDPANYVASVNLGVSLQKLHRDEEVVACFEAALLHQYPPRIEASLCTALAIGLRDLGRPEEALAPLRRALELNRGLPTEVASLGDLATALAECGRFEESFHCHEQAFALAPTSLNQCDLGLVLLRMGDYAKGFPAFEARQEAHAEPGKQSLAQMFPHLRWNGSDVAGKRILLCYEQGLGDTIQFARYATLLKERGATVILSVQASLLSLFSRLPGVDELVTEGDLIQPFDFHCHLMSLPLPFGTTVETIPNQIPYLYAHEEQRREWREWLGHAPGLKVGLVWAGNPDHKGDRNRSIPFEFVPPAAGYAGYLFLQLSGGAEVR